MRARACSEGQHTSCEKKTVDEMGYRDWFVSAETRVDTLFGCNNGRDQRSASMVGCFQCAELKVHNVFLPSVAILWKYGFPP